MDGHLGVLNISSQRPKIVSVTGMSQRIIFYPVAGIKTETRNVTCYSSTGVLPNAALVMTVVSKWNLEPGYDYWDEDLFGPTVFMRVQ